MVINQSLRRVQLIGCSFLKYNRGNSDFNPNSPNGSYVLDLEDPVDQQVALELCRLRNDQGPSSWSDVKLDGKEMRASDFTPWPEVSPIPKKGTLQLTFQWVKRPSNREDAAISDREFEASALAISDSLPLPSSARLKINYRPSFLPSTHPFTDPIRYISIPDPRHPSPVLPPEPLPPSPFLAQSVPPINPPSLDIHLAHPPTHLTTDSSILPSVSTSCLPSIPPFPPFSQAEHAKIYL